MDCIVKHVCCALQVTDNKQRIGELKALIEQRRVQRSMANLGNPAAAPDQETDPVEENAKAEVEQVKQPSLKFCK